MGVFDVFTGDPIKEGAAAKEAALRAGLSQYGDLAGKGREALTTNYTAAIQPWMNLQGGAQRGMDAYGDASGANGPEGLARARANFGQMVQPDINMGIDALVRAGNAKGVATGNTLTDATKFATNESAARYGDYVNRLNPYLSQGTAAAGGLSNVYTGLGSGLANSYTGQAGAALDTNKSIGDAQNDAAMADYVGSQNLWNFGLNAAKTAASFTPWGAAANTLGGLAGQAGTLMGGRQLMTRA